MDTILITGADGFLGSRLCEMFCRSYHVIALVRNPGTLIRLDASEFEVINENHPSLETICREAIFIIHTATVYGRAEVSVTSLLATNLLLPLKLLQYAGEKLQAFINTDSFFTKSSTSGLYGHLRHYTLSKLQLNEWLMQWPGVKILNMRLEHMYGVGDNADKFVPSLIARIYSNEKQIDLTDGLQQRDFVYIDDVRTAFATVVKNAGAFPVGYSLVEVGSGTATSIRDFAITVKTLCGSSSILNFGTIPRQRNEFEVSRADLSCLSALGYSPAYTLTQGIQQIINSIK